MADDDASSRRAMRLLLAQDGYDVLEFGDGEQALYQLAEAADVGKPPPDLLVLDFCMPGLSGIGLLRVMRRFSRVPPTVLVTGFTDASVEIFARRAGVAQVLRKPLDWEMLRSAVQNALASRA